MSLFILLEEEEMKTKERENMFLSHKGKTEENQTSFCCTAEFPRYSPEKYRCLRCKKERSEISET